MFHKHLPVPIGIQNRLKRWTFGLYPACIKYLMSAFDVPEVRTGFPLAPQTCFFTYLFS